MAAPLEPELTARAELPDGHPLRPGDWRLSVWRSFLRTHTHLLRILEQDLNHHRKIAIGSYDVLVQLAEAPAGRLRMSELAEAVLLSRSGLTRLVDRLQRSGLVRREPDPSDARGLYTVLTEKGRDALRDAATVHLAGVSRLVVDRLTDSELRTLQELMRKLDPVPLSEQAPDAGFG
ncbi:MAG: MarR family transcriptional regulator [Actinomycetota bacterium]|nr:MarR family transcriptional regulator [Actinomycetota bacterium]MDQ2956554.1 MarR family transcriptional regulator [Actinomycetota bacterium]